MTPGFILLHLGLSTTLRWLLVGAFLLLLTLRFGRRLPWGTATAIAWTVFMLGGLLSPSTSVPHVGNNDKIIHALIFIGFGFLWRRSGLSDRQTIGWGIAFAVLSELLQALLPVGRSGDWEDALADVTGVLIGLVFARLLGLFSQQVRP